MSSDRFANYIQDLGILLKEKAIEAKMAKEHTGDPYNVGRLMAFHEVVSLMQSQADQFNLTQVDIGLTDIDPERDLL